MDELNPHYVAMVEDMHVGGGFCVKYDFDFCHGSLRDGNRLRRFETWIEAYDAAVSHFHHSDHMAADPALVAA